MDVAFLGLGIMGSRMAANLQRNGHNVTVWTHSDGKAAAWAAEHNAKAAATPAEAASAGDMVISMLVDGPMVEAVMGEAAEGAREDALFVDMSTIAPDQARAISTRLGDRGIHFLDAPVTGSAPRAADATITIMAGGDAADFERAKPLFQAMGELVLHVGDTGQGQLIKLINNALAAANATAISQALVLADAAGADLEKLEQVIDSGSGGSTMMQLKARPMRMHDYETLFKTDHMLKDVRLCLEEAQREGTPFSAAALARDALAAASARGYGDSDFAAIIEPAEGAAGHRIGDA